MKFFYTFILNFTLSCLCFAFPTKDTLFITHADLNNNIAYTLDGNWKYNVGDNTEWASPGFPDSAWLTIISTSFINNEKLQKSWRRVGWFRIHFKIDSLLKNNTYRLIIMNAGKIEVYLDGKYITNASNWKNPKVIRFNSESDHLIAVKLVNDDIDKFINAEIDPGFRISIAELEKIISYNDSEIYRLLAQQMFFTALALAFCLLHLFLYLNYKSYKENLFYSLFLLAYAASLFMDYQVFFTLDINETLTSLRIHRGMMALSNALSLLFIYYVFNERLKIIFWVIISALFFTGLLAIKAPTMNLYLLELAVLVMYLEIFRITYQAIKKKHDAAWLIALGFSILLLFSLYDLFVDLEMMKEISGIENGYPFGTIGLFICMSIYVAKGFAKTNRTIVEQDRNAKEQEIQNRILEAENSRKTKELEDARKLQLSILPKTFPQFVNLEIAARMRTATEVGGDYYDYHISNDGTITIVIGDATGHGTKAGIMTTLIKSLFDTMAHTFFIPDFFNHCTRIIKKMNFGNLFMALAVVKIKSYRLVASSAGIPPMLYYNSTKKEVEEIILKGMPVGAVNDFSYQQQTNDIKPGDTILLLTDGFLEMFNNKKEMLEFERVKEIFLESAEKSPEEILDYLFKAADQWLENVTQEDDITFLVIKIK